MKSTVKETAVNFIILPSIGTFDESHERYSEDVREIIEKEQVIDKETNSERIRRQARIWLKTHT